MNISFQIFNYLYLAILAATVICCGYRYKTVDRASRIFYLFVCCSSAAEGIACYAGYAYSNNMAVYNIYSPIEFVIICTYFSNTIDVFRKNKAGYMAAAIGVVLSIIDIRVEGMYNMNSYFLVFEGTAIIAMGLFYYFRLLLASDGLLLHRNPHFWFVTIMVFFWCATLSNWHLHEYIWAHYPSMLLAVDIFVLCISMFSYIAISAVYILYPKIQQSHE